MTELVNRIRIDRFMFEPRAGRGKYSVAFIDAGDTRVEVTVSPTGRSVQVYVNEKKVSL